MQKLAKRAYNMGMNIIANCYVGYEKAYWYKLNRELFVS